LLFLLNLRTLFDDLVYVIYDNACAVARHLRKRQRSSPPADPEDVAWKWLLALKWVIDRLHFCYHRACRDETSSWYVPGVDPAEHSTLEGVDTEAAEQIFHVANRWQVVLSNAHPVHEELLLLIFARDHNRRHSCNVAAEKYRAAQARQSSAKSSAGCAAKSTAGSAADPLEEGACDMPVHVRRRKTPKVVSATCEEAAPVKLPVSASASSHSALELAVVQEPPQPFGMAKSELHSRYVWVNTRTKTVHHTVLFSSVTAGCGYFFGQSTRPRLLQKVDVDGCFTCGTCYGQRSPIHSDGA
jgi:hypothetical protein